MTDRIEDRARFDFIRYANCWEDAGILVRALQPGPGKRILSIASAGDNSLALLGEGAEVVAADLSPAQIACVELRVAGFRRLDHEALLAFLGVRDSDRRLSTYENLKNDLTEESREYWDHHPEWVEQGIIHPGKFENYFRLFRTRVIPMIHGRKEVERLLLEKTKEEREAFYEEVWNNRRWRLLFRIFFSRFMMGRLGRDKEFFRYVEGSVADRILQRTRHALTALPTHENPYLEYILTGNFSRSLPLYLEPGRFDSIRDNLDKLTIHHGPVQEAAARYGEDGFDGFNLSDIFEYLDPETCRVLYGALLEHARPGARFAYWNMLAPRRRPEALQGEVNSLEELASDLFRQDLAWFYSAFVAEEKRG